MLNFHFLCLNLLCHSECREAGKASYMLCKTKKLANCSQKLRLSGASRPQKLSYGLSSLTCCRFSECQHACQSLCA